MSDIFQFDVFLSYKSDDRERVRRLAERLRGAGLRVWFDQWVIKAGDDIYLSIERGLASARTLVLCMSPAAFGSDWVSLERSTVLFRDPGNDTRRFIPLLLADCTVPDTLRRYKYVDYRDEADAAFDELLDACRPETETPPVEQVAPKKKAEPKTTPKQSEPITLLERKLVGHGDWVRSVAVSPDGKWAASGSRDKTIKVWDIKTGVCRATLEGHTDRVLSVKITKDGKRIISASADRTVRVWDASSGRELAICNGHTNEVWSVVILPDGQLALSGSWDRTLRIWDINTGNCLKVIRTGDEDIFSTAVSHDGKIAFSGHRHGTIKMFSLETSDCLATLQDHDGIVSSIDTMSDRRYAISGGHDDTVKIWNLEIGTCVGTLEGHQDTVHSVALSPDNALVASTGFTDGTVRLWNVESGDCVRILNTEGTASPISVAFSPSGHLLLAGTARNDIYVYRVPDVKAARPAIVSRKYVNAKVVLLGESGVGKSGLAHRLIEDEFVKTESTHGMKVWRLDLPLDDKDGTEREALLWDLAGQEDYRLIHQLFLDETALALMLINPQKDDPFAEVGDWLKALRVAVTSKDARRAVAKLLVAARTDVGGIKLGQQKIDRFMEQHGFADYIATSAVRGDNCSDKGNSGQPSELKKLIARHIPWDALPWTSTPKLLADVKNAVLDMAEKKEIRLLRFAELCQRLEQALTGQSIGESDARTAVTLLANHGLVMPLKFGDLVLLRPELMNGYAGAVIRAARAHTDEIGSVCERDIYGDGFDFSGVERLDRPDEELLLRAMVQTFLDKSLCIAEDTPDGRQLIFPSQYRRERPIPAYPEIFVSYTFAGELQTIYTTLIVRMWYSRQFEQKELWRNAAEFVTTMGRTVGLVMERTGEGEGTVSVFFEAGVPDELKVVFIEFVHRHLERYARDVRRDRRYVCPRCSKPVTDYDAVRERLAAGRNFIYCQKCDRKVPLIDHIEQRLGTDPVARKVRDMEERDRRERDTQALEQILIGHMMAICGEANQLFRPAPMPEYGIDGEVEFKDKDGRPSGRKIYVRLKTDSRGLVHERTSLSGRLEHIIGEEPGVDSWLNQPADVYLVIRDPEGTIRWMNATRYLKGRKRKGRQIIFQGERLDAPAVWRVRDEYFPRPVAS
jgi:hypothetical protein